MLYNKIYIQINSLKLSSTSFKIQSSSPQKHFSKFLAPKTLETYTLILIPIIVFYLLSPQSYLLSTLITYSLHHNFQIDAEVAKLLALKAQLGEEGGKVKFLLKPPKVLFLFLLLLLQVQNFLSYMYERLF